MRFYLYSTANPDPAADAGAISFLLDPVEGEYDPDFEWDGRGAVVPTLGGRVIQDYGMVEADRSIRVAGSDLTAEERAAIEALYIQQDTEWHFTARPADDTPAPVWRVQFRRVPRGFTAVLDAPKFAIGRFYSQPPAAGYEQYRYELVLLVVARVEDES
jgi:hypothetical protein